MSFKPNLLLPLLALAVYACSSGNSTNQPQNDAQNLAQPSPVMVTIAVATTKTFEHELLCNGTLEAAASARIGFEAQGVIAEVLVKAGQKVQKGQLLGKLNNQQQEMALERARNNLARARVEMADILLGYSSKGDTTNLNPQVMQTARIKSGFIEAELALREAEYSFGKTLIEAPISGTIVDLQAKPNNPTASYEYFCQLVNEQSLQVVFSVLETELQFATPGTRVVVYPFSNQQERCQGVIAEVNRMVDKNGMVKVVARLDGPASCFIVGMNVRVLVRRPLPNQLVIPVEGLARRQNRDVVFVMPDSLALWKYVEVGPRNSTEVVIYEGVEPGERVIVKGNATIGHEAWVREID